MTSAKIEFSVEMTCDKCVQAVKSSLSNVDGIENIDVSLENGTVIVNTTLPYSLIQEKIENSGRRAVLKGYGGTEVSAVAMLGGDSGYSVGDQIRGVVRFVQAGDKCIIDGTMDGLNPGLHGLHVHECGDISKGCDSVGDHFNPHNTPHGGPGDDSTQRHSGDLGNILADKSGRATFRIVDDVLRIWDIIGRSLVVTDGADDLGKGGNQQSKIDGNSGARLTCGIIARASGLFQNTKKICACDGVTLWDERDRSVAGWKNSQGIASPSNT
ncbi:copper chaperone for superoxide dismutase isoform X2 [Athalia rosae]|nr:copper chaperone for superoxide dismutase isoform X2 [Athalia rosae]